MVFCMTSLVLSACYQPPEIEKRPQIKSSNAELQRQLKDRLLEDFSGVWEDDGSLVTLYHEQGRLHFVIDDRAIAARLGDIDPDHETVNLLVTQADNYNDGIITLRRKWTEDKQQFTLIYTSFDGRQGELGFVRRVSKEDQYRIANIYAQATAKQYEMVEQKPSLAEQLAHNQQQYEDRQSANHYAEAEATEDTVADYDNEPQTIEDAVAAAQEAANAAVQSFDPNNTF